MRSGSSMSVPILPTLLCSLLASAPTIVIHYRSISWTSIFHILLSALPVTALALVAVHSIATSWIADSFDALREAFLDIANDSYVVDTRDALVSLARSTKHEVELFFMGYQSRRKAEVAVPLRDSEFWLDRGDLVLLARGAGFRIHSDLLCRDSLWFSRRFAERAASSGRMHEGAAVISVDESAEDVRALLHALYGKDRLTGLAVAEDVETAAALLRLSSKYCIDVLRRAIVTRFEDTFPSTLPETFSIRTDRLAWQTNGDLIVLLNAARENGLISALPAAFYAAAKVLTLDEILDGARTSRRGVCARLGDENRSALIRGRDALIDKQGAVRSYWSGRLGSEAPRAGACRDADHAACADYRAACVEKAEEDAERDPREVTLLDGEMSPRRNSACNTALFATWEHIREDVWRDLPELFKLPGWNVLLEAKLGGAGKPFTV